MLVAVVDHQPKWLRLVEGDTAALREVSDKP
jgi:hypothetical protein